MIDVAVRIIADALRESLTAACLANPSGPAIAMVVRQTGDITDDRDPPALCRVDGQDSLTFAYPLDTDDPTTLTVACTVTLRRADIPSLAGATTQQMRHAVLRCERAIARALIQAFDVVHFGQIEAEGVVVRCPREITLNEPDTEVEATTTSGTVTAVFVIEDRHVLARNT